ncbi:MAG: FAD-binding oxidoreductase [Egibacteraceae bacterium]
MTVVDRANLPRPPTLRGALRPTTLAEARDAVRDTPGALLFRGGGTKQGWGAPPERVDAVVETTGLDQLVEHSAGDMVAIVGAGMRLSALQEALAPSGQWFAVDPPCVDEGVTLGGVFMTNDHGPRRLRYGAARDLVIGVTIVLADGTVAQSGGRVVKNVAGYDLMRLYCGSLGTLGLVTELIVRLHPLPEASLTARIPGRMAALCRLVLALLGSPVEPTALDVAHGTLWVRLEGRPAGIAAQAEALRTLAASHGLDVADRLGGPDETKVWRLLLAAHAGTEGETVARAATLPDRLPQAAAALAEAAAQAGVEARLASHAGLGLHTARFSGDPVAQVEGVRAWRRRIGALSGTVVLRRHVEGLGSPSDVFGPSPSAISVMRRVKAQLDPDRRCAPGRFVGGI